MAQEEKEKEKEEKVEWGSMMCRLSEERSRAQKVSAVSLPPKKKLLLLNNLQEVPSAKTSHHRGFRSI